MPEKATTPDAEQYSRQEFLARTVRDEFLVRSDMLKSQNIFKLHTNIHRCVLVLSHSMQQQSVGNASLREFVCLYRGNTL